MRDDTPACSSRPAKVEADLSERHEVEHVKQLLLDVTSDAILGGDIPTVGDMQAALVRQALTDPLTGLPNRALLTDRLSRALARLPARVSQAIDSRVLVLMVDVDNFKLVNDSLGHGVGDQILCAVAGRLKAAVGPSHTVARFGGGSFAVVCEQLSSHDGATLPGRLLAAARGPVRLGEHDVPVSVSIGVAVTSDGQCQPETLLSDADAALHRAKEQGRGRVDVFDEGLRRRAAARLELEAQLHRAVEHGELRLYYQPIVELLGERIVGCEALVRWAHPARGLIPPRDLIAVAEESGLINPIWAWNVRNSCEQLAKWDASTHSPSHRNGPQVDRFTVALNLSGRQIRQPRLVEELVAILDETGVDPTGLCIEITESSLMEDTTEVAAILGQLHELGIRLAVDDFGTGYASLLYLRRFPVDVLKLDRRFVAGLGQNGEDAAIVRATIGLASELGLDAHATGVENAQQLALLRSMGCHFAQGYLWSPAIPALDLLRCASEAPWNTHHDDIEAGVEGSGAQAEAGTMMVGAADLKADMVLCADLLRLDGAKLLAAGSALNPALIDRIAMFAATVGVVEPIHVSSRPTQRPHR
jgi:diguanylate cyclase (GGDEF)-like protein